MRKLFIFLSLMTLLMPSALLISCDADADADETPTTPDNKPENVFEELNRWMYGQMNHSYLWREDLPDSTKCNYDQSPRDFLKSILSPHDRFSYLIANPNYSPSECLDYGFAYQTYADQSGRKALYVLYQTVPSNHYAPGDFLRVISKNAAGIALRKVRLTPQQTFEDIPGSDFILTATDIFKPASSVLKDTIFTLADRNIGYLCYLEFDSTSDLAEPLQNFHEAHIDDLILDLRYNPGGYVATCQYLCNCIVNESAYEQIFQQCSYNSIIAAQNFQETGDARSYSYYKRPSSSPGHTISAPILPLNLSRLFVITSAHTASASEATIICLRPYMQVCIIGERTVGKGVGSWSITDKRFRYGIQPITMRYYNADGLSTPDEGLEPDYAMPNGYNTTRKTIGDPEEPLLNQALRLICPQAFPQPASASTTTPETSLTPVGEPSYIQAFQNKHCK